MDWNGLSKRLGNLLSPMTLPLFAANIMNELTYWHFLETISMIPLVSNHFFMIMMFIFKFHGVEAFIKVNTYESKVMQNICSKDGQSHRSK